jgi:hypothetical protein
VLSARQDDSEALVREGEGGREPDQAYSYDRDVGN